ncbi:hypothetical protein [Pleionea sediminis]|nr:hypothetical protein [Pleionea sediminis]
MKGMFMVGGNSGVFTVRINLQHSDICEMGTNSAELNELGIKK